MTDNTQPQVARAPEKVADEATNKAGSNTKKAKEGGGKPVAYTSPHPVQADGRYYKPGEVFVTDAPKGDEWEEHSPKEVAAISASTDLVPDDANLDEADVAALQAVAIIKHVSIVGIAKDKKALITAIKAAYEPHL